MRQSTTRSESLTSSTASRANSQKENTAIRTTNTANRNASPQSGNRPATTPSQGSQVANYLEAQRRIKQAELADDDDDAPNPYVGPGGLIDRNQMAQDRETVTRVELDALGVPEDVTVATIDKAKERGRFNNAVANQYARRALELLGDNAAVGNSTSQDDRAEILRKLSETRLGGYSERETVGKLKNSALDQAGIPRAQPSPLERIKRSASPEARVERAAEVAQLGGDFRNAADYTAAAKLKQDLAAIAKRGGSQGQVDQAVAEFNRAVQRNANTQRAEQVVTNNASRPARNVASSPTANSSGRNGHAVNGRLAGAQGATGSTNQGGDSGAQTSDSGGSQTSSSNSTGGNNASRTSESSSPAGNDSGTQGASHQTPTSGNASGQTTSGQSATGATSQIGQDSSSNSASAGQSGSASSNSSSQTPENSTPTVVGQVEHNIGGATWVFTVFSDGSYQQQLVDNKTGEVLQEGPSGNVQDNDQPDTVVAGGGNGNSSDSTNEQNGQGNGSGDDDDDNDQDDEDDDENDDSDEQQDSRSDTAATSDPEEEEQEEDGNDNGDSTPNPENDPEVSDELIEALLNAFPNERRQQERYLSDQRDGGYTDPAEGSEPSALTSEQVLILLERFVSEGKNQQRTIEVRKGGGHTDPVDGGEHTRTEIPPTRHQANDVLTKAGGGHTDPVDDDGSSGNATDVTSWGLPGVIGGGGPKVRAAQVGSATQIGAAQISVRVKHE